MNQDNVLFARTSETDSNPWDDSDLILAYEEAHNKVCKSLGAKPKFPSKKLTWKKGDYCRCDYSGDGQPYEAKITKILDGENCIVKYQGYGNEEKVKLKSLEGSKGPKARKQQVKESQNDCDKQSVSSRNESLADPVALPRNPTRKHNHPPTHLIDGEVCAAPAPVPPLPQIFQPKCNEASNTDEAMNAMLLSWYMNGYHTGYYEGLKNGQRKK